MEMKTILTNVAKIIAPILLGGAILYWMYRGEDFMRLRHVLLEEMNWTWMLLSFPFGILAQLFRGWRWKQTLEPIDEHPRTSTSIYAIFLSYAVSLIIPRLGEFTRCGVLKRYDGCSFSKALGTVVTERAIDTLLMGTVAGLTLLFQLSVFGTFFSQTGTSLDTILERFSLTGYSGGGKKMIAEYEAEDRDSLLDAPRIYALPQAHKHLPEMAKLCSLTRDPVLRPIVASYYSGMEVSVTLTPEVMQSVLTLDDIKTAYRDYYKTGLIRYDDSTEGGLISAGAFSGRDDMVVAVFGNDERMTLISRFDNLGKGASGAAIQNMNLLTGADEFTGLVV
jgi:hypothetical protein